jgi:hypothetical protein
MFLKNTDFFKSLSGVWHGIQKSAFLTRSQVILRQRLTNSLLRFSAEQHVSNLKVYINHLKLTEMQALVL